MEIRFQKRLRVWACSCCTLMVGEELNREKGRCEAFIFHCPSAATEPQRTKLGEIIFLIKPIIKYTIWQVFLLVDGNNEAKERVEKKSDDAKLDLCATKFKLANKSRIICAWDIK